MLDSRFTLLASLLCASLTLTACAPYAPDTKQAGICNQLNSEMVFSGSTSDTRQANIQNATEPSVQRTYDKDNCAT